jgi:hypothetical protein
MQEVSLKINNLLAQLPQGVQLVAVSKFHPASAVMEAYAAGQRVFGESRADELVRKAAELPADVEWHFIGHLQTNKVRRVVPVVSVIESIDSEHLLAAVNAEAARLERTIGVFLQVHVAAEETKTGFTPDELLDVARRISVQYPAVKVLGVMGMATNTDDAERINSDFAAIARVGAELQTIIPGASALSMGMSHDWQQAVQHGATHVRIGTDIFGPREY